MTSKNPSDFVDAFTNERLTIIAQALLEQCYETDDDLQSDFDSGYSVGCTRFDRQKNRLKQMALEYPWLDIHDGSNRLVMKVEGAPFRFTRDNYLAPKKRSSTAVSDTEAIQIEKFEKTQQLALDLGDETRDNDEYITKWRFFVDVAEDQEISQRDYEIFFVGFNAIDQPKCVWCLSEHRSSVITSVDDTRPEKVATKAPKTTLPNSDESRKLSDE
ncbi:hypothetical protein N6C01_003250 [Vibrio metschnikovii]|uniref:Uncharacterized protein n=3 Tax=Unclassified Bacteria TaxID=49928 RepID=A0AAU6UXS7_UNCXX|nr:hypothetical protein [Vibrio metschnikovii]EKO3667607.1 hypothetical protein [Vibrio metschnikovii]EKO3698714.1 hypothetical protein [Vibrio metschnikovii]EKO3719082.1 hypothetical protein [Vibrio metschnikovii]EKO3736820.1 hypothetical protein [Vibrio metschnikovii]